MKKSKKVNTTLAPSNKVKINLLLPIIVLIAGAGAFMVLKNILIIKDLTRNKVLYKEKEFIMQASLNEIGATDFESQEKVIVQGIVDLFAVGDELMLIDYKYSSLSPDALKERYQKQIDLYSLALSKAFDRKIEKRFLLSLKKATLIEL